MSDDRVIGVAAGADAFGARRVWNAGEYAADAQLRGAMPGEVFAVALFLDEVIRDGLPPLAGRRFGLVPDAQRIQWWYLTPDAYRRKQELDVDPDQALERLVERWWKIRNHHRETHDLCAFLGRNRRHDAHSRSDTYARRDAL
jgi:hypothetical protein